MLSVSFSEFLDKVQSEIDTQLSSLSQDSNTTGASSSSSGLSRDVTGAAAVPETGRSLTTAADSCGPDDVVTQLFQGELVSQVCLL